MSDIKEIYKEIERLEAAIAKTESPYLKRDYEKRIKRLRGELIVARRFSKG